MRFLLTNDDGVAAPGIHALARAVDGNGDVLVVAPEAEQSGCSHATTTNGPLRLKPLGGDRFSLDGTPADCVRVALGRFGGRFDCVLAGINSGGNLGADIYHSGTVAAVREAILHGVPGIAISHYRDRPLTDQDWLRAAGWTRTLLEELLARPIEPGAMWSINFPCLEPGAGLPEIIDCPLDLSPLPIDYREKEGLLHYCGEYRARRRKPGHDIDVCFSGRVAITKIKLS